MRRFAVAILAGAMILGSTALGDEIVYGKGSAVAEVAIDESNFKDEGFRQYIGEEFDKDGDVKLSEIERKAVTSVIVSGKGIKDLKGIEFFTALEELDCSSNQLTSLDVSHNTALKRLNCESNQLTSLNMSGCTALEELNCFFNKLKSLDISKCQNLVNVYDNPTFHDIDKEAGIAIYEYENGTCYRCLFYDSSISIIIHTFGAWRITTPATCTADGKKIRKCTSCDKEESMVIPKTGHTFGAWRITTPATCTADGKKIRKCTSCDKEESMVIPKTGHTVVTDPAVPATTTSEGKTAGSHCSVCRAVLVTQKTIPKIASPSIDGYIDINSQDHSENTVTSQIKSDEGTVIKAAHTSGSSGHTVYLEKARNSNNKEVPITTVGDGKKGVFNSKKGRKITQVVLSSAKIMDVQKNAFKGSKVKKIVINSTTVIFHKYAFKGTKSKKITILFKTKKASSLNLKKGALKGITKVTVKGLSKKEYKKLLKAAQKVGIKSNIFKRA